MREQKREVRDLSEWICVTRESVELGRAGRQSGQGSLGSECVETGETQLHSEGPATHYLTPSQSQQRRSQLNPRTGTKREGASAFQVILSIGEGRTWQHLSKKGEYDKTKLVNVVSEYRYKSNIFCE